MRSPGVLGREGPVAVRVAVAVPVGAATAVVVGELVKWRYAPAAGWVAAAGLWLAWTWVVVRPLDGQATASHATREDPTRRMAHLLVLAASIASLAGVGYLLIAGLGKGAEAVASALIGVASVAAAWFAVHTVFTLRYARLFYLDPVGGIEFHQQVPPTYVDFAYVAFTIGMTYQVSDTDLKRPTIRATALGQALVSYMLGAVVLAIAVNLVAGLSHSGG
ncbi:MAG: putative rane protein [Mycobacterium sp.]|nr:putative rane protein [Mycobacterium sp.]